MNIPSVIEINVKSETINKALDILAKAGCVLYEPTRIRKNSKATAEAEAEAKIIKIKTEIKTSALQKQALNRLLSIETSRQENINKISYKALKNIDSSGNNIDSTTDIDWIKKYFSFSQDISNQDMQNLWANVLSGEFIKSGSFSYKTMSILANMRKNEAELFSSICSYVVSVEQKKFPLIYEEPRGDDNKKYNKKFDFEDMQFLQSLGLIHFNDIGEYNLTANSKNIHAVVGNKSFLISSETENKNTFNIGKVLLTREGQELCSIINSNKSEDLLEIVKNKLVSKDKSISEIVSYKN